MNYIKLASANLSCFTLSKQACLFNTIDRHNLDIINIQETHWDLSNTQQLKLSRSFFKDFYLFNSFKQKNDSYGGIITLIKKKLNPTILNFEELVSGRLTNLKIEIKDKTINIVNWYGRQEMDDIFHEIFDKLTEILQYSIIHNELVYIVGDTQMTTYGHTKFSNLTTKDKTLREWLNSHKLYDFVPRIVQSSFTQYDGNKVYAKSRPDHIISNINNMIDCQDINIYTQHNIISATIDINVQSKNFSTSYTKFIYNWENITTNIEEIDKEIISQQYSNINEIQDHLMNILENYKIIKKHNGSSITKCKEYQNLLYIKNDIYKYYHKQKKKLNSISTKYFQNNSKPNNLEIKQVLKTLDNEMENCIKIKLKERKQAFINQVNNLSTKKPFSYPFRRECKNSSIFEVVKTDNFEDEIIDHFSKMFNTELENSTLNTNLIDKFNIYNIELKTFTKKSLFKTIATTKNSMAGWDNIPVKFLKMLDSKAIDKFVEPFNKIIEGKESIPSSFKQGILIPLPKVDRPTKLNNFRPIVVLPTLYRILSTFINGQIMDIINNNPGIINENQRGFLAKSSTTDNLSVVRTVVNDYIQKGKSIFIATLDIKNAYGSVIHSKLIETLRTKGFNSNTCNLIENMMSDHHIKILANESISKNFTSTIGVPQGDPTSPILFNLYFDLISSISKSFKGVSLGNKNITILLYADDIIVLSESANEMNQILKKLTELGKQLGLHFAEEKCKVLGKTPSGNRSRAKIFLNNLNINQKTHNIEYLGAILKASNFEWVAPANVLKKMVSRTTSFRPKMLKLNTARVVFSSKVLSIPRYLCGIGAIPLSDLMKLESNISGAIKRKMGWDIRLSKAVIYGDKSIGGFGITSPKDIYFIERCASIFRFSNSSSQITKYSIRKTILDVEQGLIEDNFIQEFINTLNTNYWNWIEPRDTNSPSEWSIVKTNNSPPDIRQELLKSLREERSISYMGNLDTNNEWHFLTFSFWINPTLSLFQQRLCFANLHKAQILNNIANKNTPIICESCNAVADWTHVFWSCNRCQYELAECRKQWSEITTKFNLNDIDIGLQPTDPKTLTFSPNGIILRSNFKQWKHKKIIKSDTLNKIYRIFVTYIENCYKNADWNSKLGHKRNYSISDKQKKHPTQWQSYLSNLNNRPRIN